MLLEAPLDVNLGHLSELCFPFFTSAERANEPRVSITYQDVGLNTNMMIDTLVKTYGNCFTVVPHFTSGTSLPSSSHAPFEASPVTPSSSSTEVPVPRDPSDFDSWGQSTLGALRPIDLAASSN